MPDANVTNSGTTPVIPANLLVGAKTLFLQNNSDTDLRYRRGKEVTASGEKSGLVLSANGGATVVTGELATIPVYAMHEADGETKTLTWDSLNV